MRCPRCHRETSDPVPAFCRACGAPLRLVEEPPAPPLTATVAIDRRGDGEGDRTSAGVVPPPLRPAPAAAPRPPARREELAELDRSHWDLGRTADVRRDPTLPPPARAGPAPARPVTPAPPAAPKAAAAPLHPAIPPAVAHAAPHRSAQPPAPAALAPPRVPAAAAHAAPHGSPRPAAAPDARPEAVRPEPVLEVHVRRADPWRRAAAWAIDALPFAAAGAALARTFVRAAAAGAAAPATALDLLDFVARERVIVLSVAAAMIVALATYTTLAHALAGATFGKRLLRLRVVGPHGERPSLARSAARSALALLSAALLGLGFLLALFAPRGRALHDLLARTWVVAQP